MAPAGKECTASPRKRPGLEPGVTAHFTGAVREEKHTGTLGSSPRGRRKTSSQPHSPGRERVEVAVLAVWGGLGSEECPWRPREEGDLAV